MACFLVPAAEAIITTAVEKTLRQHEKAEAASTHFEAPAKTAFSTKLGWLNRLLWGGSALLAFEHVWHGEVVPFFPFLTAVENGEAAEMLAEMGSIGVTMAVLVTCAWGAMVLVSSALEKKAAEEKGV